ncbi:MAG TPA: aspartyl protease family protein [Blastocatellia bacterium]|nr:aspartyl protease family protein [Blastocatellia bacterium]
MKVKGIESDKSSSQSSVFSFSSKTARGSLPARNCKSKTRNKVLIAALLFAALALSQMVAPPRAALADSKTTIERLHRDAKKALRKGDYEKASNIYADLLRLDQQDAQAKLGSAFAHFKMQDYIVCFNQASEVTKSDPANAQAHALAGLALLRSGYIRAAINELRLALVNNPKEALAFGGLAEIDYYEGRTRDARAKALYAHNLDPDEPDYLITYARASSRAEDFKEAADAYEIFLQVAPETDRERRERIQGLIKFYRRLAGIQVHQLTGPDVTEIPFKIGGDRRPYMHVKVNGRDAVFVIDTGSGFTVIAKESAKRLGVSEVAHGGKSQGVGGDGKFPIVYGLIKSFEMGDAKLRMVPCFIRPFHGAEDRPADERADGLVGLSVLSKFLTELDYRDGRLRLNRNSTQPLSASATPDQTVVPFRTTQNGLISIETELDGNHTINAILDSAASSTVISTAAVERLNLRDRIIKGQTANVIGAAGVANNVELLFIRNCRVANLEQTNLRALVLDFNAINETSGFEQSGILGGDFLRHFSVTIDFNRAQVAFKPHTNK